MSNDKSIINIKYLKIKNSIFEFDLSFVICNLLFYFYKKYQLVSWLSPLP